MAGDILFLHVCWREAARLVADRIACTNLVDSDMLFLCVCVCVGCVGDEQARKKSKWRWALGVVDEVDNGKMNASALAARLLPFVFVCVFVCLLTHQPHIFDRRSMVRAGRTVQFSSCALLSPGLLFFLMWLGRKQPRCLFC